MQRYKNLEGTSGVSRYEIGEDFIKVEFVGDGTYLYNHEKPGRDAVDRMKSLAARGKGLSTYISTHVQKNYAAKLR